MLNFQVQKLLDGGCLGTRKYLQHKALMESPRTVHWHQDEFLANSQKASIYGTQLLVVLTDQDAPCPNFLKKF